VSHAFKSKDRCRRLECWQRNRSRERAGDAPGDSNARSPFESRIAKFRNPKNEFSILRNEGNKAPRSHFTILRNEGNGVKTTWISQKIPRPVPPS
jgi:hypothetical protein